MKGKSIWIFFILISFLVLTGCEKEEEVPVKEPTFQELFVGSAECKSCHDTEYAEFITTGHPYKLNKAADVRAGNYYPYSDVPEPPAGTSWDDVTYVIGGYGWKARFIGKDGYIITAGGSNQYNLLDGSWSDYHKDEEKPYNCGKCHTTGYVPEGNQDNLPGIEGTWAFPGVQCEVCHGPGKEHVDDPYKNEMEVDRSSSLCGKCHVRGDPNAIPAKGGYIRHHEQYNEILATKKFNFNCVDCHDPHKSAHYAEDGTVYSTKFDFPEKPGIKIQCSTCHYEKAEALEASDIGKKHTFQRCLGCHMPYASKSAMARDQHTGDVRTHLFAINTDTTKSMFSDDGSLANGYLTLEYTCLNSCHSDKDLSWAKSKSDLIHQ
ncbi:MAG: multiheme c-type cytochrome [Fidelibacterota bacterium]